MLLTELFEEDRSLMENNKKISPTYSKDTLLVGVGKKHQNFIKNNHC